MKLVWLNISISTTPRCYQLKEQANMKINVKTRIILIKNQTVWVRDNRTTHLN